MLTGFPRLVSVVWFAFHFAGVAATEATFQVGVGAIDITPDYPIRLTGYAVRKTESAGVEQRLWAKALAIGSDADGPAILLAVDNCGVSALVVDEVAARLKNAAGIARERLAVCSSHTHSGPCVAGFAPNIFAMSIPAEQETVDVNFKNTILKARGRHDPCVLPRAVPMVEAMTALVLVDHALRHRAQCE